MEYVISVGIYLVTGFVFWVICLCPTYRKAYKSLKSKSPDGFTVGMLHKEALVISKFNRGYLSPEETPILMGYAIFWPIILPLLTVAVIRDGISALKSSVFSHPLKAHKNGKPNKK